MRNLAIGWVVFVVAIMPLQAVLSRRQVQDRRPTRFQAYVSTVTGLLVLGTITFVIDWFSGRTGLAAVRPVSAPGNTTQWSILTFLACLVVWFLGMLQRKLWRQRPDEVIALLLPRSGAEQTAFGVVSVVAGTVEEYVMRGFCLLVLAQTTHSMALAVLIVTVAFSLAHGYQGPAAIVRSGLLGLALTVPVIITGSVVPSMIAHAATDLLSGTCSRPLLRHWDLLPPD